MVRTNARNMRINGINIETSRVNQEIEKQAKSVLELDAGCDYDLDLILPTRTGAEVYIYGKGGSVKSISKKGLEGVSNSTLITNTAEFDLTARDLKVNGNITVEGSYMALLDNCKIRGDVDFTFGLSTNINNCEIFPNEIGISLNTTGRPNLTQCNQSIISQTRIRAKEGVKYGVYINNSNNVHLEGVIVEGFAVDAAVYFRNITTTVNNFSMHRPHFECVGYNEGAFVLEGRVLLADLKSMRVTGKGNYIKSKAGKQCGSIRVSDNQFKGWDGKIEGDQSFLDGRFGFLNKFTRWEIESPHLSVAAYKRLFKRKNEKGTLLPWKSRTFFNGVNVKVR